MPRCFVIQPFDDGGRYDKRYDDVFAPAIIQAGLEPYRVDRDPRVNIPVEDIEQGIRAADVCLAEISTDNPNVWFELGYAFACGHQVVLVLCSNEREMGFPFDVQHRNITTYLAHSSSDFERAKESITERLMAVLIQQGQSAQRRPSVLRHSTSRLSPTSSSSDEEIRAEEFEGLIAAAEERDNPQEGISAYNFRLKMTKAGFSRMAATLAIESLVQKGMLERYEEESYRDEPYTALRVTPKGMKWLFANKDRIPLLTSGRPSESLEITDDDIPF